jgi:predicted ferric reductase
VTVDARDDTAPKTEAPARTAGPKAGVWPPRVGLHPGIVLALYLLLALAPIAIAAALPLEPRPFWDEVASALGLAALSIMCLEFMLSGRYRTVSGRIGIDLTMRFHQLVAHSLVVFMLIHPFVYTTPMGHAVPWDTGEHLRLGLDTWSIVTGAIAWGLLVVMVATAIGRRLLPYTYESWRGAHALGAVVITGLVAHHAFAAGRYSGEPAMIAFWVVLLTLAGLTLVYVYVIRPVQQKRAPYAVQSVQSVAADTWELRLKAQDGDGAHKSLAFQPGQFAWVKIGRHPFQVREHPFSISTAPEDAPEIGFTIRENGDFTDRIGEIQPGTPAYLDGPHGNFVPDADPVATVYVAGGVGIAPILSHLRAFRAEGDRRPVTLIYGNRTLEHVASRDELERLAGEINLTLHYVLQRPPEGWTGQRGMITQGVLDATLPREGRETARYFICGPGGMIDATDSNLRELGVPAHRIISEKFDYN